MKDELIQLIESIDDDSVLAYLLRYVQLYASHHLS